MLFQFDISGVEWILGIGISFGLAFVMSNLTRKNLPSFLTWLTIFVGVVVWAGLLDLWALILCIVVLTGVIFLEMTSNKGGIEG